MINELSNILLIITVFLSLIFGIVLIIINNSKKPTLLLGLFLITYSSEVVSPLVEQFLSASFFYQFLFFPFSSTTLFSAPLLYLYAKNLVAPISLKQEIIHFMPGAIDFLFFSILFFLPIATKKWLYFGEETDMYWLFYGHINFLYAIFYIIKTIKFINKYQLEVQNFYSTLEGKLLTWVKYIAFFLGFVGFVWINLSILVNIFLDNESVTIITSYPALILDGVNLFFICYTTVMGLKQISLLEFSQMKLEDLQVKTQPTINNVEEKKKAHNQFYSQIIEYMDSKEPFTDPNLTLLSLSSKLNIQPRRLSEVIKQETTYNFNQFVNKFRVDKAKQLLISTEYSHFSILGIAGEAGFNSKATFNTSFKQFTKMTPSQFKKQAQ